MLQRGREGFCHFTWPGQLAWPGDGGAMGSGRPREVPLLRPDLYATSYGQPCQELHRGVAGQAGGHRVDEGES